MKKRILNIAFAGIMLLPFSLNAQSVSWRAAEGPLTTPWTNQVTPDNVHNEYPRSQMTREKWAGCIQRSW